MTTTLIIIAVLVFSFLLLCAIVRFIYQANKADSIEFEPTKVINDYSVVDDYSFNNLEKVVLITLFGNRINAEYIGQTKSFFIFRNKNKDWATPKYGSKIIRVTFNDLKSGEMTIEMVKQ